MIRILPEVTLPWRERFVRRHSLAIVKSSQDFAVYRPCLRWEFGFSCSFCLLHEADIAASGAKGWAFMGIEHFAPQSLQPDRVNDYANCFYICSRCNSARGNKQPDESENLTLLNPVDYAWRESFDVINDEIQPADPGDQDAAYTVSAYKPNDPGKVKARRMRRVLIRQCLDYLEDAATIHEELLDKAEETGDKSLVDQAEKVHSMRRLPRQDLLRFQAIPEDCDTSCRCGTTVNHSLPSVLEEQTFPLPRA
jgi:hypothetical protein